MKVIYLINILIVAVFSCCTKFLDVKPTAKISSPDSYEDIELLLDAYFTFNSRSPNGAELASDNFYVSLADLNAAIERERSCYLWEANDNIGPFWSAPYSAIFTANMIIDEVDKIVPRDAQRAHVLKSKALFYRAFHYFTLSQLFCPAYGSAAEKQRFGLPLKKTADVQEAVERSTVSETYEFILDDLKVALNGLGKREDRPFQGSIPAAYGMLARVYLSMGKYEDAGKYADSCLRVYDELMDYNTIDLNQNIPFAQFNKEVIFDAQAIAAVLLERSRGRVVSELLDQYDPADLRKKAFFVSNKDGSYAFKGNYTGLDNGTLFIGLATDELFLIRAECHARAGRIQEALRDLNSLLSNRYVKSNFVPVSIDQSEELVERILEERRKQLLCRAIRWSDLRRLNLEQGREKILTRKMDDKEYTLLPNSDRYLFQIYRESILYGGYEQNP